MYKLAKLYFETIKSGKKTFSGEIPCDGNHICQNGGTCYGTVLSYQCFCSEGYTGNHCESKLRVIRVVLCSTSTATAKCKSQFSIIYHQWFCSSTFY